MTLAAKDEIRHTTNCRFVLKSIDADSKESFVLISYIIYISYAGITAKKEIIVIAKRLSFLPSLITVMTWSFVDMLQRL